ncbi:hypothetical protein PFICI_06437 [Pestalotiopsis fici W106-1]|uniref:Heterokaryon incompatibility domain-containing protein n=1 Tax=Pestalotiopsis fici (strain W106-1 / CGMCC3.15140) TaxID=1229662 RepID=W3X5V4_PESFW|nr:uncharacterized protein PFICI_06437 [Pestalotiopsis fici W106-1]ETS81435.1 hypothetical protein PFICI_06437 [Pestalotiopsis fici W106-1]
MRLINTSTYQLREFVGAGIPPYAILSHTWEDDEVLFDDLQDMHKTRRRKERGFIKVEQCCARALADGWDWVWIDNCCIDKSSSAELSEAINSMYQWYQNAMVCYAYLSDVDSLPALETCLESMASVRAGNARPPNALNPCRWFHRSWTLQELIAPRSVCFYGAHWSYLATKAELGTRLAQATGIYYGVLTHELPVMEVSACEKMRWAAGRQATRAEDVSYSLLGLFDINMPLLYGEGSKAFYRLQEYILAGGEQTILFFDIQPWNPGNSALDEGKSKKLAAQSPEDFAAVPMRMHIQRVHWSDPRYVRHAGEFGLRIQLPCRKLTKQDIEALSLPSIKDQDWHLIALSLLEVSNPANQIPILYSTRNNKRIRSDSPAARRVGLIASIGRDEDQFFRQQVKRCFVSSKYVLVSNEDVFSWKIIPLEMVPLLSSHSRLATFEVFIVESSHSMCALASRNNYEIATSESLVKTSMLDHRERYWILSGPDKLVVAYFKLAKSCTQFLYRIQKFPIDTNAHEILDNWRWRSEQGLFKNLPMSSPFLLEERFTIDQHLDAAFLVSRKLGTQLVIKVNFMVQNTSKASIKHASHLVSGDLDGSIPTFFGLPP